jgi:hypothetical protein
MKTMQTHTSDKHTLHGVPPIFASSPDDQGRQASHPAQPANPDQTSKAPKRPEDTTSSGDALNDSGEDNHRRQQE